MLNWKFRNQRKLKYNFLGFRTCSSETFININFNDTIKYTKINKNIKFNNMDSKFIGKSKLTKSGQVTLPKEARQDLKIDQNSEIYWYEINDVLVLAKDIVNPSDIFDLINSKKKKRNK